MQHPDVFATVTFHTKPFYGGKLHRVTGEVKSNGGAHIACRFQGEWNRQLEFIYEEGQHGASGERSDTYYAETLDVASIDWSTRKLRPVEKQDLRESRRLWRSVTEALRKGDYDVASQEKQRIEQAQRVVDVSQYVPVFFEKLNGDGQAAATGNSDTWIHKEMPRAE